MNIIYLFTFILTFNICIITNLWASLDTRQAHTLQTTSDKKKEYLTTQYTSVTTKQQSIAIDDNSIDFKSVYSQIDSKSYKAIINMKQKRDCNNRLNCFIRLLCCPCFFIAKNIKKPDNLET